MKVLRKLLCAYIKSLKGEVFESNQSVTETKDLARGFPAHNVVLHVKWPLMTKFPNIQKVLS